MDKDEISTPSVVKQKWWTSVFMYSESSIINLKRSKETKSIYIRGSRRSSDVTWCLLMEDVHRKDVSQEKEELNKELLPQKSPGGSSSQKKQPSVLLDHWESREEESHLHNCLLSVVHTSFSWASQEPGLPAAVSLKLYCTRMQHSANTEAKINSAERRRAGTS